MHVGAQTLDSMVGQPVTELLTTPNLITLSGYAAGLAWLAGGSPAWVLWSLAADELDGEAARALGQESTMGAHLDWGVDVAFTALLALKMGTWWAAPLMLLGQAVLKESDFAPPFGSLRAATMLYAVGMGI